MRAVLEVMCRYHDKDVGDNRRLPLQELIAQKDARFGVGAFRLTYADVHEIMRAAYFSWVDGIEEQRHLPQTAMQLMVMVTRTPVANMHDRAPLRMLAFSVTGVNVSANPVDIARYVHQRSVIRGKLLVRYKVILAHLLACMQREAVDIPVLCAVGCGAFSEGYGDEVTAIVAQAAATVLSENQKSYTSFKCVVLCLPSRTNRTFPVFVETFRVCSLKRYPRMWRRSWRFL